MSTGSLGVNRLQLAEHFQPIQAGHGNIDDRDIGGGLAHELNGFFSIGGFRHDFHFSAFFNDSAQTGPYNTVVVGQQYVYH
jgi:hypothetical protein